MNNKIDRRRTTQKLIKNRIGEQHGDLTVVQLAKRRDNGAYWECLCSCGSSHVVSARVLAGGETSSCGCKRKLKQSAALLKHGHNKQHNPSKTYVAW